jgi:hypothetical protein
MVVRFVRHSVPGGEEMGMPEVDDFSVWSAIKMKPLAWMIEVLQFCRQLRPASASVPRTYRYSALTNRLKIRRTMSQRIK